MASTNVIRRAASRVIPAATRSHRSCSTVFTTAAPITRIFSSSFSTATKQQYSTTRRELDDSLLKVVDSEIHYAQDSNDNHKVEDIPESFSFKIEDEPGKRKVTLTRDDHGESITVEVHIPELTTGEENEDDDDDSESYIQSQLPMVVRVSKDVGPCFEFGVSAYPDKIEIETLSITTAREDKIGYVGPVFGELNENLQKGFHKFLDIRGINPQLTKFMHEYMETKELKEYVGWLKKVKKFLEVYANNDDNGNNIGHSIDNENRVCENDDNEGDDNQNNVGDNDDNNLEGWRERKIEFVYYFNLKTGEYTYEKPVGFKVDDIEESSTGPNMKFGTLYLYTMLAANSTHATVVKFKVEKYNW